jgi:hypothetical protein
MRSATASSATSCAPPATRVDSAGDQSSSPTASARGKSIAAAPSELSTWSPHALATPPSTRPPPGGMPPSTAYVYM